MKLLKNGHRTGTCTQFPDNTASSIISMQDYSKTISLFVFNVVKKKKNIYIFLNDYFHYSVGNNDFHLYFKMIYTEH